jgi:hypothetical protein
MINIKNIASVLVAISLSILLVVASFSGGHPDAYFFPRIITSIMLFLSLLLLIQHFYGKNHPIKKINIAKLTPFFILIIIFILLGENLGFYLCASLMFLTISYFYYPEKKDMKKIIFFLLISAVFMLAIYFLFTFLLKVQVPRFFLF